MLGVELAHQRTDEIRGDRRCHRDPQVAAAQVVYVMDRPLGGVQILQGQSSVQGVRLAGIGEPDGAPRAVEQGTPTSRSSCLICCDKVGCDTCRPRRRG